MVAEKIPGTLKPLSDSLCLLPSINCLKHGCHGCKQGLLHVGETEATRNHGLSHEEETEANHFVTNKKGLREAEPKVECSAAVCGSPYSLILGKPATCFCVPVPHEVYGKTTDLWTELLIGSFKSKDFETRGDLIRLEISSVSHDLQNYVDRSGECYAVEEFNIASLIVPRLTEIVINLALTFWFKVDGFSSALVARRAMRDYIVDNTRRGFAAHVFMNKAEVRSNEDNTNAYQVL